MVEAQKTGRGWGGSALVFPGKGGALVNEEDVSLKELGDFLINNGVFSGKNVCEFFCMLIRIGIQQ